MYVEEDLNIRVTQKHDSESEGEKEEPEEESLADRLRNEIVSLKGRIGQLEDLQPIPLDQTGGKKETQKEEEPKKLKFVEKLEEESQPEADINIRVSQTYDSEEEGEAAALIVELID